MSTPLQTPSSKPMSRPQKKGVPEGLWLKCKGCGEMIYRDEADKLLGTCPVCEFHFYVTAKQRIAQVLDEGTFEELDGGIMPTDPLEFRDKKAYADRPVSYTHLTLPTKA